MKFIVAALLISSVCHAQSSQATLNIQVIIPPVLDVSKNVHPIVVQPFEQVQQRLTVFSNIREYCITLHARGFPAWRPKLLSGTGELQGRTLCSTKLGTSEFVLEHQFGNVNEISWPVTIEVAAP